MLNVVQRSWSFPWKGKSIPWIFFQGIDWNPEFYPRHSTSGIPSTLSILHQAFYLIHSTSGILRCSYRGCSTLGILRCYSSPGKRRLRVFLNIIIEKLNLKNIYVILDPVELWVTKPNLTKRQNGFDEIISSSNWVWRNRISCFYLTFLAI